MIILRENWERQMAGWKRPVPPSRSYSARMMELQFKMSMMSDPSRRATTAGIHSPNYSTILKLNLPRKRSIRDASLMSAANLNKRVSKMSMFSERVAVEANAVKLTISLVTFRANIGCIWHRSGASLSWVPKQRLTDSWINSVQIKPSKVPILTLLRRRGKRRLIMLTLPEALVSWRISRTLPSWFSRQVPLLVNSMQRSLKGPTMRITMKNTLRSKARGPRPPSSNLKYYLKLALTRTDSRRLVIKRQRPESHSTR